MRPEIGVGPAIKTICNHVGEEIGWDILSQVVALVHGSPEVARLSIEGNAHGIPRNARVDHTVFSIRSGHQNRGTARVRFYRDIRSGTHGDKDFIAIGAKGERPGPML